MKWLITVLAFVGAVAFGFFGLRNRKPASSAWTDAEDSAFSSSKTATEKPGAATDKVAGAASDAVDGVKGAVGSS
jgi:hypothetical protein